MHFEIPAILLDASVRSLCLALAAWITLRLFRVRDGAQRHAAWTVVLCAMLLMPLLAPVLPALRLRVLPVRPETPAALLVPVPANPGIVATSSSASQSTPAVPVVAMVYVITAFAMLSYLAYGWLMAHRLLRGSSVL